MGSGISEMATKAVQKNYQYSNITRVLQSDHSTSAFLKYLERNVKGCLLKLYLDISQYKQTNNEFLLRQAFTDANSICKLNSSVADDNDHSSWPQQLQKLINDILLRPSNITSIDSIEEFCCFHLSHESKDFVESHEYNPRTRRPSASEIIKKLRNVSNTNISNTNILIIDDSPNNSQSLTFQLKSDGHSVRQANHGWIGTHIATLDHFDVILIDLAMNTMDPHEVIKRIKDNRQTINDGPGIGISNATRSPVFVGLNYSEYDLTSAPDIAFPIDVATLKSSKSLKTHSSSFLEAFNARFSRYNNEYGSNHGETCCDSTACSYKGQ